MNGKYATGWMMIDGVWYYFSPAKADLGVMQTGWEFVDGKWYYMAESGAMMTGWQFINEKWYYLNASGDMFTGWLWDVNYNAWYYMHGENGDMLVNTTTPDGYFVGADGKWVQ